MRSLLFVPGDSERKLAKGETVGADALVLGQAHAAALVDSGRQRQSAAGGSALERAHLVGRLR